MNKPNPLVPQGSLEEKSRGKSHVRIAVITILAIHVVLLGALLIQGCKREEPVLPPPAFQEPTNTITEPTNTIPAQTNVVPLTNVIAPPLTNTVVLPPADATEHVVVKGDSFYTLGKKYGVSIKAITAANPGVDSSRLKLGQKLVIPAKTAPVPRGDNTTAPAPDAGAEGLYIVKSGDVLSKIATAHGTTVKALMAANNLKTSQIKVNQKLKLPARTTPAPVAPVPVPSAPAAPGTVPTGTLIP